MSGKERDNQFVILGKLDATLILSSRTPRTSFKPSHFRAQSGVTLHCVSDRSCSQRRMKRSGGWGRIYYGACAFPASQ
jgi:hypothetical protein